MLDDVFLILTFPDGVTRTVGDMPVDRLRSSALEWKRLHPGTIAELRRGHETVEVLLTAEEAIAAALR
jgi:hypothetical protein